MYAGLTLITPPNGEPISVADATLHSRILVGADASMVAGYIAAARHLAEKYVRRALLTQTWQLALRNFPGREYDRVREFGTLRDYYKRNHIELPRPPFQSVGSFTYQDTSGNIFSMVNVGAPPAGSGTYDASSGNYTIDSGSDLCRLTLPFSGVWPTTILLPGSPILIQFFAGYKSFAGVCNVDSTGLLITDLSGSGFDPSMAGTFIQIGGATCTVATVASTPSGGTLILAAPTTPNQVTAAWSANAVPHAIKQAIIMLAADLYQNREATLVDSEAIEVPYGPKALLDEYVNFHPLGQ